MLKKIFAKLRASITPSRAAKPAAPTGKPVPNLPHKPQVAQSRGEARQDRGHLGQGSAGRTQGGDRGRGQGGKQHGQPSREQNREQPRRSDRGGRSDRDDRGGQGQGGRGLQSRSGRGRGGPHGERERPLTDKTFDHPRTAEVKPSIPVDVPKMDTAFTALGLSDAL